MTLFPCTISYRAVTGVFTRGVWTKTETAGTFVGSVQPMSFHDLQALEIGREDLGKVKVFSNTVLNVSKEGGSNSGDIVIWEGKEYEIIQEMNYQNDLIPHYKYIGEYRRDA